MSLTPRLLLVAPPAEEVLRRIVGVAVVQEDAGDAPRARVQVLQYEIQGCFKGGPLVV